ncbi:MAG: Unknown protein [uncultured Sulfurovum sp.]|uniref:Uncharacterized protein n=1 Tax=uncultured Sulfurovum sp. TaxID=269237 RepID=A0A6S6T6P9_9BACT|nr:MAG: Unknown protein [uncultured Sulfurovum sp.]
MMYFITRTILFLTLFLLSSCVSPKLKNPYMHSTAYHLNIEHIFVPPSDEYHPYSLLHYSKKSGYTVLCSASILSNISKEKLSEKLKESNIPDTKLAAGSMLEFGISLNKTEVANLGFDYKKIKALLITLTDGKKITMPSMHMYTAKKNLASSECKKEISIYLDSYKDSKYYIPNSMYQYTIKSKILDLNNIDITAEVPPALKQLIFAKARVQVGSIGSMNFSGENLYIGFNGITLTHKFSPMIPKDRIRKDMILDVTKIVNKIQKQNKKEK